MWLEGSGTLGSARKAGGGFACEAALYALTGGCAVPWSTEAQREQMIGTTRHSLHIPGVPL